MKMTDSTGKVRRVRFTRRAHYLAISVLVSVALVTGLVWPFVVIPG